MIIIKGISWSGCTRKIKKNKQTKSSVLIECKWVGGLWLPWPPHTEFPAWHETNSQSCRYTVRNRALYHLHFKAVIKSVGFSFLFCFCGGNFFYFFILFCFLVQHNLEHLKAFQPKCGGKQVRHYFCKKLAFLIVQMDLVPLKVVRGDTLTRLI